MMKLNVKKLRETKKVITISSEEALKDVVPINWSQNLLDGNKIILSSKN